MGNVVQLPPTGHCPNNESVAQFLRDLAGQVDDPEARDVDSITFVIEYTAGTLEFGSCGKPTDRARMVGIMAIATNQMMTQQADDGEYEV
jgi:hypothetical protein